MTDRAPGLRASVVGRSAPSGTAGGPPAISVIIPTYNRASMLRASLAALCRQSLPASEFEVIVAVDGSEDETLDMLAGLQTPFALRVLTQRNSGQHVARNLGIRAAAGRVCLFIDDDIEADPHLLRAHLCAHERQPGIVGIGRIDLVVPPGTTGFVQAHATSWHGHFVSLGSGERTPTWLDCFGGNLSVERDVLLDTGGFSTDLRRSHDVELGFRLVQRGLRPTYIPGAVGRQLEDKGIEALAATFERSGAAWVRLYERHPATLPDLLGTFHAVRRREVFLRRVLLALRIPVPLLAVAGKWLAPVQAEKWYFFLHRLAYWRGVRRAVPNSDTWRRMTGGTVILMYHAFDNATENGGRYVIPIQRFSRQLRWLRRLGYRVLSLEEYVRARREHHLLPARSVVITIDDGYAETLTLAAPVLRRFGVTASVFVVSGAIGAGNDWSKDRALRGRRLLTWSEVKRLAQEGIRLGAHSRTHARLTVLTAEQAWDEIAGSRADLEKVIEAPVTAFAYPYGEYDASLDSLMRQAGFAVGCTGDGGINTPGTSLLALRRFEVHGTDSLLTFMLGVSLGEAWRTRRPRATGSRRGIGTRVTA